MKRRILSMIMALSMSASMLTQAVLAESESEEPVFCSCETLCTADSVNGDCAVCIENFADCIGEEPKSEDEEDIARDGGENDEKPADDDYEAPDETDDEEEIPADSSDDDIETGDDENENSTDDFDDDDFSADDGADEAAENEIICECEMPCSADSVNEECAICAENFADCALAMSLYTFVARDIVPAAVSGNPTDMPNDYTVSLLNPKENDDFLQNPDRYLLKDGDEVSLYDTLIFFVEMDNLKGLTAEQKYKFNFPDGLKSQNTSYSYTATTQVGSQTYDFATLSWDDENTPIVVFHDYSVTNGSASISLMEILTDIKLGFHAALDDDKLSSVGNDGKVKIDFKGYADSLEIIVTEKKPHEPELKKEVGDWNDGITEWTITYTAPSAGWEGGKHDKITDILPVGLSPVSGSTTVKIGGGSETALNNVWTNGADNAYKLEYSLSDVSAGQTVVIKYKTELNGYGWSGIWSGSESSFTNSAQAEYSASDKTPLKASATVKVPNDWSGKNLLTKEHTTGFSAKNPKIDWTVTVNTHSQSFETLTLTDIHGDALTLDKNSIKVNDNTTTDYTYSDTDRTLTIDLTKFSKAESYKITYTTTVNNDYFIGKGGSLKNKAEIQYKFADGADGKASASKNPGEGISHGAMITKSYADYGQGGYGYEYQTHSMKWKVTVNPNQVDMTSVHIVEQLGGAEQKFGDDVIEKVKESIQESLPSLTDSDIEITKTDDKTLDIKIQNGIGTNKLEFYIFSYAADPNIWANNSNPKPTYTNTAILKSDTKVESHALGNDTSAKADISPWTGMFQKKSAQYDPATKYLKWSILVNQSKADIGTATVADKLPAGLSYVEGSAKYLISQESYEYFNNQFSSGDWKTVTPEYDSDNSTLTFELKDANKQTLVLIYDTEVDINSEDFKDDGSAEFVNQATMTSTANPNSIEASGKAVITSAPLQKSVAQTSGTNKADYTVNINPLGMNLGQSLTLTDKMSAGLILDEDSVTLYEAAVTSERSDDGKFSLVSKKNSAAAENIGLKYDMASNQFSVKIPNPEQPYILEYTVYASATGVELKNEVTFNADFSSDDEQPYNSVSTFKLGAMGSANFSWPSGMKSLTLTKVDGNNNPLANAEIGLYSGQDEDKLICTAISGDDGICRFVYRESNASANTLYYREITPPDGYIPDEDWHEIDLSSVADGDIGTLENIALTAENSGSIIIVKQSSDTNEPLKGAEFQLFSDRECSNAVGSAKKSGSDGKITFYGLEPEQSYWLKEISAPTGYQALAEPIELKAQTSPNPEVIENDTIVVTPPDNDNSNGNGGGGSGGSLSGSGDDNDSSDDSSSDDYSSANSSRNDEVVSLTADSSFAVFGSSYSDVLDGVRNDPVLYNAFLNVLQAEPDFYKELVGAVGQNDDYRDILSRIRSDYINMISAIPVANPLTGVCHG